MILKFDRQIYYFKSRFHLRNFIVLSKNLFRNKRISTRINLKRRKYARYCEFNP